MLTMSPLYPLSRGAHFLVSSAVLKPLKKGGCYLDPEAEAKIAAVANQGK